MQELQQFFRECINSKVAQCEHEAAKMTPQAHCNRHYYELMQAQALYFDDQREELVQSMLAAKVAKNLDAVDYFLLNAFIKTFSTAVNTQPAKDPQDRVSSDYAGPIWDEQTIRKMCQPLTLNAHYRLKPESIPSLLELAWSQSGLTDGD